MKRTSLIIGAFITVLLISACGTPTPPPLDTSDAAVIIKAKEILTALKNKNAVSFSNFVHPTSGVRFSPYVNVKATDQVFQPAQIAGLFANNQIINWGISDGSGEPINLTFSDYFTKFIYNKDFLASQNITVGQTPQRGNMINNIAQFYPGTSIVEFHIPGTDPQYDGMDWGSLYIILKQSGDAWYLMGVVHDQWTI